MHEPFLARLPMGEDLLESITEAFKERSIPKASFVVIGAVTSAVLAFYDPQTRKYENKEFPGLLEIASCVGNVSERDGGIFVHAHITLAGEDFQCVGGHLMQGTKIFAAELQGIPVPGKTPIREYDEPTGLFLWAEF
ncbi:MAG: DNA-binding protein [Desulfomonile tiedjei]|uniref:DNA-binding protein n=1 Tax=Desulfomonile tiedjei TaxID=2358 RepID=A0A9D6V1Y0_9BACT|nr:DNA-binding protein [Desulfomonile tiedjei]